MTLSHAVTIGGWIVIAGAITAAAVVTAASHGRSATAAALVRAISRHAVGRAILLATWGWIGWHFFVRTSR